MLSLQELEVFVVAAENGNFSEAGRLLGLSQPAISQTIHHLEKRFDMQLFVRHGRTVRLSDVGESLLPMAQELLASARRLEETMSSLNGIVLGKVTIGCSTASGKYLLPHLIAQFRARFPQVRVDMLLASRDDLLRDLLDGQVNFGIISKQVEHQDLEYLPFYSDEVILIVGVHHPWALQRRISAAALTGMPVILREESCETTEIVRQGLLSKGISPDMLNVATVLGSTEAVEMAVAEGIGYAFLSRLAATQGLDAGRVIEVQVDGLSLKRDLYFVRNQRFPYTQSQLEFWNFVEANRQVRDGLRALVR